MLCPICHSENIQTFYKYDNFTLLHCQKCDLIFREDYHSVTKDLITEVYDENWITMREKYTKNIFLEHASFNITLLNIFTPKKGELLEIGAGTGEFLYLAQAAGWNVTGFEPSLPTCSYVQEKYNIKLINSLWDKSKLTDDCMFDIITFWHVLEHLAQPLQFLEEVASVLSPQGLIFFSIPNKNSFTNKIYGYSSPLYLEADHLFHYSLKSLITLIKQTPLEALALFSREEVCRLFQDLKAHEELSKSWQSPTFPEMMALQAQLQSKFAGHEIFCIARKKQP